MDSSRREFFKQAVALVGVGVALPSVIASVAKAEEKRGARGGAAGGGDLPLVQPGQGMAASVNYHASTKDVKDAKLKTDRQGVKFENQACKGCMLYTAAGKKDGADVGKCQLFANQLVKADGWCTSWAKKA